LLIFIPLRNIFSVFLNVLDFSLDFFIPQTQQRNLYQTMFV